jgi:hypothetical protein
MLSGAAYTFRDSILAATTAKLREVTGRDFRELSLRTFREFIFFQAQIG